MSSVSKAQQRKRALLQRLKVPQDPPCASTAAGGQQFSVLLRQLYKKTHPDLLRSRSTAASSHNDNAWKTLNGILTTVKQAEAYPPAISQSLSLYLRPSSGSEVEELDRAELRIHTAGGDCQRSLTASFHQLFRNAELSTSEHPDWIWDDEYFSLTKSSKQGEDT